MVTATAPEVNISGMARNGKDPPHIPKKPAGSRESYCVPMLEVPQPPQHHLGRQETGQESREERIKE